MANAPIWNGCTDLTEVPDSPHWSSANNRVTCTRVWEGPYDKCISNQPLKGSTNPEVGVYLPVEHVEAEHLPGNKGRLTVTFETPGPTNNGTTYEIEYVAVERKLEQHPRYQAGGACALTDADLIALDFWDNEANYALRTAFQFKDDSDTTQTLSANAQDLAKKKKRGQDSYDVYAPVARATLPNRDLPASGPCGFISTPEVPNAPTGYIYVKTAHRATMSGRYGKWEDIQEWTGFDFVDPDLYPSA